MNKKQKYFTYQTPEHIKNELEKIATEIRMKTGKNVLWSHLLRCAVELIIEKRYEKPFDKLFELVINRATEK